MPLEIIGRTKPSIARHFRRGLSISSATLVLLLGIGAAASAEKLTPLGQRGLELSRLHCARCHIVSDEDRFTGTSSTPSFKIMIEYLKDWKERFDTFMARNPHPAHIRLDGDGPRPENLPATIREVILSLDDIEAIRAYVDSIADHLGQNRDP